MRLGLECVPVRLVEVKWSPSKEGVECGVVFDGLVNVAADDKLAWQNTRLITQKWIEAHPTDGVAVSGWPFTVIHVEVPFEVPLTTVDGVEVLFVGRMDVVGEYLGGYVVVDHKTTGFINSMWTDQWAMDGQVTGYIWAIYRDWETDRKSTRLNSSHSAKSRMPSSA